MFTPKQHKETLLANLPIIDTNRSINYLNSLKEKKCDTIIVLDDDPTGTQTVHGVPVLTTWSVEELVQEFEARTPVFYILTNSRSLIEEDATQLTQEIGHNIKKAAQKTDTQYWLISRSDSTLRGHYPAEVEALGSCLDLKKSVRFFIPAFFEGGRYTIHDIHYVAQADQFVPAAQTIYAKDHVFGYRSSNLIEWIIEKSKGKIRRDQIRSISIQALRTKSIESLSQSINELAPSSICLINAADYTDLHIFSAALCKSSVQPVFRTAASFVASIAGISPKPLLTSRELIKDSSKGGLIIVGSYVDTTSRQLRYLQESKPNLRAIEIDIPKVLQLADLNELARRISLQIDQSIQIGQSIILYTSRNLVSAQSNLEKQQIGRKVSSILTNIVKGIQVPPSYIISKGGITSSDIATEGLGIKRAKVLGQVINGVPVWQLGSETKFPNSIQIIFPGNVGQVSSLATVVDKLQVKN